MGKNTDPTHDEPQPADMTFWEHLDVLRGSIVRMLVATAACAAVAFIFKEALFDAVLAPSKSDFITYRILAWIASLAGASDMPDVTVKLVNTGLATQFSVHIRTALWAGLLAASPYVIYLLFRFVAPALYAEERKYTIGVVGSGYVLFLVGIAVNYFLIFPLTFRFLGTYQVSDEVENLISLSSYMDTLLTMCLALGVVFEVPVVCWLLARIGILTAAKMQHYRKHAVVAIMVVAAIITPTSDILTLTLVALPIWLLYEASIVLVRLTVKAKRDAA